MFASGAFARHVSPVAFGAGVPAERTGLAGTASLASLLGDLVRCETAEDLRGWLSAYAQQHGFRGGRYLHLGHLYIGQPMPRWKLHRFLSTHDDWADLWVNGDADMGAMLVAFLPFAWSNGDGQGLSDVQREWQEANQLERLPAGITVPVQDHAGGPACLILFGGSDEAALDLIDAETPSLVTTALAFHLLAKVILVPSTALGSALSDREIACLRLAAMGDTLAETAAKLGISIRTVEFHVGRANQKLKAVNKLQAVAMAVGAGLIQI